MRRLAVLLLVAACGGNSDSASSELRVFAAASLTEAFTEMGEAFMDENPNMQVTFNFAGSSALAVQIVEGAEVDVIATADVATMEVVVEAGLAGEPVVFTTNRPQIVVEPGNPLAISTLADLEDPELVVLVCSPQVPCGEYAAAIFDRADVDVVPDSYEANAKAVVTKVAIGEADASIGYATDVLAAGGDVDGVAIPDDVNVLAEYSMAITADASRSDAATSFVELVSSEAGQTILAEFGFESP